MTPGFGWGSLRFGEKNYEDSSISISVCTGTAAA